MGNSLSCPACSSETNRGGLSFGTQWAVACHVSGCIYVKDKLHISWARQHAPDVNLKQTVPRLAEALLWLVHQAIESKRVKAPHDGETPIAILHRFERKLHDYVRDRLQRHFGAEGETWWIEGIPLQIRQDCAQRREADPGHELYQYTYLIHLKTIIEKNWTIFEEDQAKLRAMVPQFQKKQFLDFLTKVNDVRNQHAHPIRAPGTESAKYTTDLQLARTLEFIVDFLVADRAVMGSSAQSKGQRGLVQ
jgi:hypothetical protein